MVGRSLVVGWSCAVFKVGQGGTGLEPADWVSLS